MKSYAIKEITMKKLLMGITVLALSLFASSVIAAGPKAPKYLCLNYAFNADYYHQLVFKAVGNIPTSNGVAKIYTINGRAMGLSNNPVHGSGYIDPSTSVMHATYIGYGQGLATSFELFFNVSTNSGSLWSRFMHADGSNGFDVTDVFGVSCETRPLPTAMATTGTDKFDGE
jgi:hypothetical protein